MKEPVRQLIKRSAPRTAHRLHLRRVLPYPVQGEATTESDFVKVTALWPLVKSVASQPETIELPGRTYTPDYRVETVDGGSSIWEVKLNASVPKYRALFDVAARHLANRGLPFFVISEKSLRRQLQHQEVRLILRYAKGHFDAADVNKVQQHLRANPKGSSIEQLVSGLNVTKELLFHLISTRAIAFAGALHTGPSSRLIHIDYLEQKDVLHLARWLGVSPWRTNA